MSLAGLPHSDISASTLVCSYTELIAACHVLHRLFVPRHPPSALSSLIKNLPKSIPLHTRLCSQLEDTRLPFSSYTIQLSKNGLNRRLRSYTLWNSVPVVSICGDDRDRTGDLWLAKPPLSQLSYIPEVNLMGLSGVEPLTSRLSGARSNQLSYRP